MEGMAAAVQGGARQHARERPSPSCTATCRWCPSAGWGRRRCTSCARAYRATPGCAPAAPARQVLLISIVPMAGFAVLAARKP